MMTKLEGQTCEKCGHVLKEGDRVVAVARSGNKSPRFFHRPCAQESGVLPSEPNTRTKFSGATALFWGAGVKCDYCTQAKIKDGLPFVTPKTWGHNANLLVCSACYSFLYEMIAVPAQRLEASIREFEASLGTSK